MKATWNGAVLARSDDIVEVEGNAYFPSSALDRRYVVDSPTRTDCHGKGTARYSTLQVDAKTDADAAWCYSRPEPGAERVADRVAFRRGVSVTR